MFKAKLSDVALFRDSLACIAELITEGSFRVKKDGIHLAAADPTMVSMVDFSFLSTQFDSYKTAGEQVLGLNLDNFLSILKRAGASDKLLLEVDEDSNKLSITLEGTSTRTFTLPLIDVEAADLPEMKLDFPATVEVKTGVLEDGVGDASIVTDTIVLGAGPDGFTMTARGDLNQVELKVDKKSKDLVSLNAKEAVASKFSLDYVKKMVKAAKLADAVKLELGKDFPARLTFRALDRMQLVYILAPRVED